jgi:hypothetical protein
MSSPANENAGWAPGALGKTDGSPKHSTTLAHAWRNAKRIPRFLNTSINVTPTAEHIGLELRHNHFRRVRVVRLGAIGTVEVNRSIEGYAWARLARCGCGALFAYRAGPYARTTPPPRCSDCQRASASRRQRERRAQSRAHQLAQRCARCGCEMSPQRVTRRFCSTACRVAALRRSRAYARIEEPSP